MGKAVAKVREGADVAIVYFPSEEPDAREVLSLIRAEGRTGLGLPGDPREEEFCRHLVAETVKGLGGLDIVVNNAGRQQSRASLLDISDDDFVATMNYVKSLAWSEGNPGERNRAARASPVVRSRHRARTSRPAGGARIDLRAARRAGRQLHHGQRLRRGRRQRAALDREELPRHRGEDHDRPGRHAEPREEKEQCGCDSGIRPAPKRALAHGTD